VTLRPVEAVAPTGEVAIIDKGVSEGEIVVADGQNQLRPGSKVSFARVGLVGWRSRGRARTSRRRHEGSRQQTMSVSEARSSPASGGNIAVDRTGCCCRVCLATASFRCRVPQVDYPTIVVATALPGASAETMASAVTTPLERQFGQMPSLGPDDIGIQLRQFPDHVAVRSGA